MAEDNKEYRIETVNDMLKIPADKVDHFLVDLRNYLNTINHLKTLADEVDTGGGFTWVDDGKHDHKFNVTFEEKDD